jgi:hypothetical protein
LSTIEEPIERLAITILKDLEYNTPEYQKFTEDIQNKLNISLNEINEFLYGANHIGNETWHTVTKKRVLAIAKQKSKNRYKMLEVLKKVNSRQRTQWLLEYLEYYGTKVQQEKRVNNTEAERFLGVSRQTVYLVLRELNQLIAVTESIYGKKAFIIIAVIIKNNKRSVWKNGMVQF